MSRGRRVRRPRLDGEVVVVDGGYFFLAAFDRAGNRYIPDSGNDRVRKVAPNGTITPVAGGTDADRLVRPAAVVTDAEGAFFIADPGNHRIVKLASR